MIFRTSLTLLLVTLLLASSAVAKDTHGKERIFVTNERDGRITMIDASADTVIGSFMVGGRPRGIRASRDGKTLYVAVSKPGVLPKERAKEYDFVVSIDVSSDDPKKCGVKRMYDVGSDPEQVDITPDGRHFVVANEDAGTASIIDVHTGEKIAELVAGLEPEGARTAASGKFAYVTSEAGNTISVIDMAKKEITKSLLVGSRPRDVAFCEKHHKAFVTNEHSSDLSVIDTRKHEIIGKVMLPKGSLPMCAVASSDGRRIYVSNGRGNSVSVIDCEHDSVITSIKTGGRTWGLALNHDASKLYAANSFDNTISIIDTRVMRVVKTLKSGDGPWGIVATQ